MFPLFNFCAIILSILIASAQLGFAGEPLRRKSRSFRCCPQTCQTCAYPCRASAPPPCTCVLTRVYTLGTNLHLYYAEYNESDCGEQQPVYVYGDWGENPNQVCENSDECESGYGCVKPYSDTIPHKTKYRFDGFRAPLGPNHPTNWGSTITPVADYWVKYDIEQEGRSYKAHLFELSYDNPADSAPARTVYIAFEVSRFPIGQNPAPTVLDDSEVKRCVGLHAYSLRYDQKKVLFFTDREG